ncbi:unnamed protein product, partial [marine sediment metagenome]
MSGKGSSLHIKGNILLTIFGKYLDHKKIERLKHFDSLFNELIEINLPDMIKD